MANICKMMYFTVYLLLASVCLVGSVRTKLKTMDYFVKLKTIFIIGI